MRCPGTACVTASSVTVVREWLPGALGAGRRLVAGPSHSIGPAVDRQPAAAWPRPLPRHLAERCGGEHPAPLRVRTRVTYPRGVARLYEPVPVRRRPAWMPPVEHGASADGVNTVARTVGGAVGGRAGGHAPGRRSPARERRVCGAFWPASRRAAVAVAFALSPPGRTFRAVKVPCRWTGRGTEGE